MGYFNITDVPEIWRERNDQNPAHMNEDKYRELSKPKPGSVPLVDRSDPDEFHYSWRHAAYMTARRRGFLDGIFWTLKVTAWTTFLVLLILGLNGYFD